MERLIGAQMYTVRDHIQNEADIETTIQKLADIGYKFGQNSAMGPIAAPKSSRKFATRRGIRLQATTRAGTRS